MSNEGKITYPLPLEGHQSGNPREFRFVKFFQEQATQYSLSEDFLNQFGYCFNESMLFQAVSEITHIPMLRSIVFWSLREFNLEEEQASNVMLAFEEALANILRHSYLPHECKWIQFKISRTPSALHIEIWDRGSFGKNSLLAEMMEKIPKEGGPAFKQRGGMGLYLMHRLMSRIHYEPGGEKNFLQMTKFFESE